MATITTITTIVCDRCGCVLDKKSSAYEYTLIAATKHKWLLSDTRVIDLCEDCKIELEEWLNGEDFSTGVTKNDD